MASTERVLKLVLNVEDVLLFAKNNFQKIMANVVFRGLPLRALSLGAALIGAQLSLTPAAMADASFVMHRKEAGRVTNEMRMWVRGHQMRVGEVSGLKGYLIYDKNARTITQVDEQQKVYRVVDEQAIRQLKDTLAGLQASMMSQLPPEQREKMQAALSAAMGQPGMGGSAQSPISTQEREQLTLRAVAQDREVAGISCEVIEQYAVKEKVRELCVTSAKNLGLLASDIAVAQSFFNYVKDVAQQLPGGQSLVEQMSFWNPLMEKVPLQVKRLEGGAVSSVYEMAKIDTQPVDAKLFAMPTDYRRAGVLQP